MMQAKPTILNTAQQNVWRFETRNRCACMIRCMNVDEARRVCKDRSRWCYVVSDMKKAWIYVCVMYAQHYVHLPSPLHLQSSPRLPCTVTRANNLSLYCSTYKHDFTWIRVTMFTFIIILKTCLWQLKS